MNKTQLLALIKEELNNVLNEAPKMKAAKGKKMTHADKMAASDAARAKALAPAKSSGRPYDAPIFKRLNGLEYRELSISGGPKTAKALEKLASKRGPKYAAGVYYGAVKGSYDSKYASAAYDEQFGNTMSEYEKDVMNLDKIISQEWDSGADIIETKKPIKEAMHSLAAYYTQAGRIGSGEYNLRNALEEIDDILNSLKNAELKSELMSSISDAIDMAYDIGVEEGYEQNESYTPKAKGSVNEALDLISVVKTGEKKAPGEFDPDAVDKEYKILFKNKPVGKLTKTGYFGDITGTMYGLQLPNLSTYRGSSAMFKGDNPAKEEKWEATDLRMRISSFLRSKTGSLWIARLKKKDPDAHLELTF